MSAKIQAGSMVVTKPMKVLPPMDPYDKLIWCISENKNRGRYHPEDLVPASPQLSDEAMVEKVKQALMKETNEGRGLFVDLARAALKAIREG